MGYYGVYHDPRELVHFGIKRRSGRYPYGSGERPYQDQEQAKAQKRAERSAKMKAAAKKVASGTGKAVWTGITVALKVVASSAITSATIAGLATAGFQFLQSPAAQTIMHKVGIAAGNLLWSNFVQPAANQAAKSIDSVIGQAVKEVGAIDPGTPNLSQVLDGTEYLSKVDWNRVAIEGVKIAKALS